MYNSIQVLNLIFLKSLRGKENLNYKKIKKAHQVRAAASKTIALCQDQKSS